MRASKNKQHFLLENEELRTRLEEAEETLRAIRAGEVDALFRAFVMKPFTIEKGPNFCGGCWIRTEPKNHLLFAALTKKK